METEFQNYVLVRTEIFGSDIPLNTYIEKIKDGRDRRLASRTFYTKDWSVDLVTGINPNIKKYRAIFSFIQMFLIGKGFETPSIFDVLDGSIIESLCKWGRNRGAYYRLLMALRFISSECRVGSFFSIAGSLSHIDDYNGYINALKKLKEELPYYILIVKKLHEENKQDGARNVSFLLSHESPFQLYFKIRNELYRQSALTDRNKSLTSASLIFDMCLSCPLRIKNFYGLTWLGELSKSEKISRVLGKKIGCIYKVNGNYYIYVHQLLLKNKANDNISSININLSRMNDRLDTYTQHLSISDQFFNVSTPDTLAARFKKSTSSVLLSMFFEESNVDGEPHPGINPHAMRHVSATLYLRENPDNLIGLATLLMDDLDTVMSTYADRSDKINSVRIATWSEDMERNHAN